MWPSGTLMQWWSRFCSGIGNHRVHLWNGGSLLFSKIAIYFLYFVAIPPFIHAHGQGAYGTVAFFSTMIGYTVLLENGLSYAVTWRYTRALAQDNPQPEKIIRAAVPLYSLLAILPILFLGTMAEYISISIWNKLDYSSEIRLLGFAVAFLILDALPASVLQSHNRLVILNINRLIVDAIRVSALFVAIFVDDPLHTVILFFLLSAIIKLALDCWSCFKEVGASKIFRPLFSWGEVQANVRIAPLMFVVAGLSLIISLYDKIVIAKILPEADYAYYAFASDVCTKAYIIFFAFSSTAYNTLIRRYATSTSLRGMMYAYIAALVAMAFFYYIPLSIFGWIPVTHYLGQSFSAHVMPLIQVISVAAMLYLGFTVFEANLNAKGNISFVLFAYIGGLAVLFSLAPYMVAKYSSLGMGISLAAMYGIMLIIASSAYFFSRRSLA